MMTDARRVGAQIMRFRELAGLSKSELARRLGVSPTAVHNWEANAVMPRLEVLIAMEKVLEVDIIQLMAGDDGGGEATRPASDRPQKTGQPQVSRHERLDQFRRQIAALFEVPADRVEIVIRT
jgi:transcriptional regulator with XRE-family HTH domain